VGRLLDVLASAAAFAGGVVLLTLQSANTSGYSLTGHNVFEGVSHGIGLYVLGKALFMLRTTGFADLGMIELRSISETLRRQTAEISSQTASKWRPDEDETDDII
jgi:hypothetical protein